MNQTEGQVPTGGPTSGLVPKAENLEPLRVPDFTRSLREVGLPALHPIPPVPWLTPTMSHRKNYELGREILIHNAEGKLSEGIFSEILEIDGPAMGSFSDSCYGLIKSALKANCCSQASSRYQLSAFKYSCSA